METMRETSDGSRILMVGAAVLFAVGLGACGSGNDNGGKDAGGGSDASNGADAAEFQAFHDSCTITTGPGADVDETTTNLREAFINAAEDDVVCMVEGEYKVKDQLDITKSNVTLRGEGQDKTVLDFAPQSEGSNGILVQAEKNFAARDFTIMNTASDALKTKRVDGVVMKNLTVTWEGGASSDNGAYGLYPVESKNVLIEGSKVSYAADAGVYLGQSENAILRDNEAFGNVIGLEVENTDNTDVYNNNAHGNANGILVINLPGLEYKAKGATNRVFDNTVTENNHDNFGKQGTAVAKMPQGSGILLVTADETEVFDNTIEDNQSVGVGIANYEKFANNINDMDYEPYPEGNWVHDNELKNNGYDPKDGAVLAKQMNGKAPQIFTMGTYDDSKDNSDGSLTNCAKGNKTAGGDPLEMIIIDSTSPCPNDPMGNAPSFCQVNSCTHDSLSEISLPQRVLDMAK